MSGGMKDGAHYRKNPRRYRPGVGNRQGIGFKPDEVKRVELEEYRKRKEDEKNE